MGAGTRGRSRAADEGIPADGSAVPHEGTARGNGKLGALPLVIGVTGHRDLRREDLPELEKQVEAILLRLRARCPSTPLIVLSPLAEGADRLVARVALRCGARLTVPLPMAREEYLTDFDAVGSRAEFDELLAQADRWFELPLLPGNTGENTRDQNGHRAEQYALVGAYIVRHCQILIALWNGLAAPVPGGTADVVRFQREGVPRKYRRSLAGEDGSPRSYLDPVERGPVYHIVTPRAGHPGVSGEPLSMRIDWPGGPAKEEGTPEGRAAATFDRILDDIDAFNRDALDVESDPALRSQRERSEGYLLPDPEADGLPPSLGALRERYAAADTLAQRYQRRTLEVLQALCGLVFLALLSFELTAKLAPDSGMLSLIFPGLLGMTYLVWHTTVRRGQWQDRHQDYRALAEGLRVQFFWRMAGLRTSVADHYLRKQRGELDWIRIGIRNLSDGPHEDLDVPGTRQRCTLVLEHWVRNQRDYFRRAARRDEREMRRFEAWVKLLVAASPAVAALTGLAMIIPTPLAEWIHHHALAHKLLIILVFVLAGVGGVLHTYIDKRALAQHVKQYERMANLFGVAEERLRECLASGGDGAREVLLELGREALAENGDWVLTHRERPVDVPHAG